jgi:hypothetical protein
MTEISDTSNRGSITAQVCTMVFILYHDAESEFVHPQYEIKRGKSVLLKPIDVAGSYLSENESIGYHSK